MEILILFFLQGCIVAEQEVIILKLQQVVLTCSPPGNVHGYVVWGFGNLIQ